ncbi:MAG TPA: toprim domain-containing protein, partial [Myxococcota bacterium]|nr:toprim domain-containing protein [Myxococcota bacterium]
RETQAILGIRGKILNVERARIDRMLSSQEIQALIAAIGCGIGSEFDVTKARYHKVIIMTDADVDGSHIRTLLLTFFYRQMRDLIERGYLYIAQPPLFKVKKGKSERYVKDEPALRSHLLDLALRSSAIVPAGTDEALPADSARQLLGLAGEYGRLLARIALRRIDERVVDAAVWAGVPREADLADAPALESRIAERLRRTLGETAPGALPVAFSVEPDPEHGGFSLLAETRRAGVTYRTPFHAEFVRSSDYQRLGILASQMTQFGRGPFRITGAAGEGDAALATPVLLLERVLELGQKGLSVQRYKGLGEMNPEQLSDTTMDPAKRTLLQVRIEDAYEADEMFSRLMGDEVEPRREFIERNALDAQNLDV